jgi:hypothetical protein
MPLTLPLEIPPLYSTEVKSVDDTIIAFRLFALGSAASWLISEYDPEQRLMFGYCDLFGIGKMGGAEWGYISLDELEQLRFLGIPRIEIDKSFEPKPFRDCVRPDGTII